MRCGSINKRLTKWWEKRAHGGLNLTQIPAQGEWHWSLFYGESPALPALLMQRVSGFIVIICNSKENDCTSEGSNLEETHAQNFGNFPSTFLSLFYFIRYFWESGRLASFFQAGNKRMNHLHWRQISFLLTFAILCLVLSVTGMGNMCVSHLLCRVAISLGKKVKERPRNQTFPITSTLEWNQLRIL